MEVDWKDQKQAKLAKMIYSLQVSMNLNKNKFDFEDFDTKKLIESFKQQLKNLIK